MRPRTKLLFPLALLFAVQLLVPGHAHAACPNSSANCGVGAIVGGEITDPTNWFLSGTFTVAELKGSQLSLAEYELSAQGTFDSSDPVRTGSGRMELFTRDATGEPRIAYAFGVRLVHTGSSAVLTSGTSWAGQYITVRGRIAGALAHQEG